jgi:hypothetical protein
MSTIDLSNQVPWLQEALSGGDIRPYVYMRSENHIQNPGELHTTTWFDANQVLFPDALNLNTLGFGEGILNLENKAFGPDLAMPKWVFYDCAIVPGFVCGFAMRKNRLPESYIQALGIDLKTCEEWIPISLFIIIPTIHQGEWVAHNLCAINSLVPLQDRLYGLGFLTKAFGLWYANVETCIGMTQWGKPALKLHSHFGYLQVITAYTPIHTYAKTMTYRCQVSTSVWDLFFTKQEDHYFIGNFYPSQIEIDPKSESSMVSLQKRIESKEGPFYLSPFEIHKKDLFDPQTLYLKKG